MKFASYSFSSGKGVGSSLPLSRLLAESQALARTIILTIVCVSVCVLGAGGSSSHHSRDLSALLSLSRAQVWPSRLEDKEAGREGCTVNPSLQMTEWIQKADAEFWRCQK